MSSHTSVVSANRIKEIVYIAQREIKLEGATNFRDLGGYPTQNGYETKWNKIYRAGDISRLSDNDLRKLESLNLSVNYDLRSAEEYLKSRDKLPDNVLRLEMTGAGKGLNPENLLKIPGTVDTKQIMSAIYTDIKNLKIVYKPLFDQMLSLDENNSLMFHCTAGKDRTGIGAALVLSALDVVREVIIEDYLATNHYWRSRKLLEEMLDTHGIPKNITDPLLNADTEYINSMFEAIEKHFGTVASFLNKEVGLIPDKLAVLRKLYLN
jgi:protein-tyrosine phosphatase